MSLARRAYSIFGGILLVELALQFYLIAAGALSVWAAQDNAGSVYAAFKNGDKFASLHGFVGTFVIPITILVMIALAFAARLSRRDKGQTAGLFGLMVIQFVLGVIGSSGSVAGAVVGGLHGLVALAIVGAAGSLVFRTWALKGSAPSTAQ
jgi:ABC-type maltose transport system permease subunit